jgi:hypothetical protein
MVVDVRWKTIRGFELASLYGILAWGVDLDLNFPLWLMHRYLVNDCASYFRLRTFRNRKCVLGRIRPVFFNGYLVRSDSGGFTMLISR